MEAQTQKRKYRKSSGETPGRVAQRKQAYETACKYNRMLLEGKSPTKLASELGCSRGKIIFYLKRFGFKTKPITAHAVAQSISPEQRLNRWKAKWKLRIERCCADDGCWVWDGARFKPSPKGAPDVEYSSISAFFNRYGYTYKFFTAHRLSYFLFKGDIPEGMTVDHKCYNPLCVNPDHLQLLTLSENSSRKSEGWHEKQRARRGLPKNARVNVPTSPTLSPTARSA